MLGQRLGWPADSLRVHALPREVGPGNVLCAVVESEQVAEVFTGFGEKSVRAEAVAEGVAAEVRADLEAGVPVGAHLADQLILLLAMAGGGSFRTLPLSGHARTQLELVAEWTGVRFAVDEKSGLVAVGA